MKPVLLACILTLLWVDSTAEAKGHSYRACDELGGDAAASCTAAAEAKCNTLKGYWPKQKCADKVALDFDICFKNNTYETSCSAYKPAFVSVCGGSTDLDLNKPETIPEFKRKAMAIDGFLVEAEKFRSDWGTCFSKKDPTDKERACAGSSGDVNRCRFAATSYRKSFKESVDFYLDKTHPQKLKHMDLYAGKGKFDVVHSMALDSIKSLGLLQTLNTAMPSYSHRTAALKATMKQLRGIEKIATVNAAKTMAGVRCPKGKGNSRGLLKTLRPSVNKFFATGTPQTVKKFALTSSKKFVRRKTIGRNPTRTEVTEAYAGHACTQGIAADTQKPLCQVFSISVKRSKIGRKPWSPWTTFVGDSKSMLCKNL